MATGFSGAGFKIASGVGSLIARRALNYPTHPDLEGTLRFADPGSLRLDDGAVTDQTPAGQPWPTC